MTSRQLRLLRAASASSVATLFAAVSHTIAGGPAPHPLLLLAVSLLLVPLAAILIGLRPSRSRVALTVLVSQAAFHLIFQLLGAPGADGAVTAAHQHHPIPLGHVSVAALPDALMIVGHLVAALLTIVLLWRGESIAQSILDWVRALLRGDVVGPRADHERPTPVPADPRPGAEVVPDSAISRRGPPVLA